MSYSMERPIGDDELGAWVPELDDVDAHLAELRQQRAIESGDLQRLALPETPEALRALLLPTIQRLETAFSDAANHARTHYPQETMDSSDKLSQTKITAVDLPVETHRLRVLRYEKAGPREAVTYCLTAYAPPAGTQESLRATDELPASFLDYLPRFRDQAGKPSDKWFELSLPAASCLARNELLYDIQVNERITDFNNIFNNQHYYPLLAEPQQIEGESRTPIPLLPLPHDRDRTLYDKQGSQALYFDHLRQAVLSLEAAARG